MNNEFTFTITATMDKRWMNTFCSMLKYMEHCGDIGHSSSITFYSDGDGDFRPKFNIDCPFESNGFIFDSENGQRIVSNSEVLFDADINRSKF